jgi:hypothetical protein
MGASCVRKGLTTVLDLDSPRWRAFDGDAVPNLLRRLALDPSAEVRYELWDSLCHQGSVYVRTLAATPHVVEIAGRCGGEARVELAMFAGEVASGVETSVLESADGDIQEAFVQSLPAASKLVVDLLNGPPLGSACVVHLLEALAALKGFGFASRNLDALLDGVVSTYCPCPGCGVELVVGQGNGMLRVTTDNPWVDEAPAWSDVVLPGPVPAWDGTFSRSSAGAWLSHFAKQQGETGLASRIPPLFGAAPCPACGQRFPLLETLDDEESWYWRVAPR